MWREREGSMDKKEIAENLNDSSSNHNKPGPSAVRRVERHIWSRLGSGFVVLVPLIVTLLILRIVFDYLDGIFRPLLEATPLNIPGIGAAIVLVLFYVVGAFFAGERLRAWQDAILSRIPVVKTIYGVVRQATEAISSPMGHHFSRVVFIEWPRPGVKAMGFVTGHLVGQDSMGGTQVAVYIPTVPNPTSGMLAFVPEDDIIESNISVQDAMKTVFSGGIVLPQPRQQPSLHPVSSLDESADRP